MASLFLPAWRFSRAYHIASIVVALALFSGDPALARRYASIVVNADTGTVIHQDNANSRIYPASLTKMMSLYLLFEALERKRIKLTDTLRVSSRAARQPASRLGLKAGERIRVDAAIKALVVKSANDVAVVIAERLAKTEKKFASLMTKKARQLGMRKTVFRNASGLPHRRQVSTVRDLSKLALALKRRFPRYYRFFSLQRFNYGGTTIETHNKVLKDYDGADGLKTGYIRASGFNIASSAERGGVSLIGIVVGGRTASSRDTHIMNLLDRSFRAVRAVARKPGTEKVAPQPPALYMAHKAMEKKRKVTALSIRSWGIQVGAFTALDSAHKEARRAAARLKKDKRILVSPTVQSTSGKTLYRARLFGFESRRTAKRTCSRLKRKNFNCAIVKPGRIQIAALGNRTRGP